MSASIDTIQQTLFARPLPPLEPGTKVYDKSLTSQIKALKEHRFVIACEHGSNLIYRDDPPAILTPALHLANDDIHNAHLIAQDSEGVSFSTEGPAYPWRVVASLMKGSNS